MEGSSRFFWCSPLLFGIRAGFSVEWYSWRCTVGFDEVDSSEYTGCDVGFGREIMLVACAFPVCVVLDDPAPHVSQLLSSSSSPTLAILRSWMYWWEYDGFAVHDYCVAEPAKKCSLDRRHDGYLLGSGFQSLVLMVTSLSISSSLLEACLWFRSLRFSSGTTVDFAGSTSSPWCLHIPGPTADETPDHGDDASN